MQKYIPRTQKVSNRLSALRQKKRNSLWNFLIVSFAILIVPIYPVFGTLLYENGVIDARGFEVDESQILHTGDYQESQATASIDDSGFIEPSLIVEDERDWGERNDIQEYIVQSGDTLGVLAESFNLDVNTIKWANNMTSSSLKIGQTLQILPVDGVAHKVKKWEGLKKLASAYKVEIANILEANSLTEVTDLQVDQSIIIPGAKPLPKPKPKPVYRAPVTNSTAGNHSYAGATQYLSNTDKNGYYPLKVEVSSGCRNFAYGHCTCFVAKHKKNVNWRGNAKDWLANAQAKGWPTGSNPIPGAIVVYRGPGTHPLYGHVAIVRQVNADGTMIVSDMNYRRWNEVTTRRERINHRAIIGYIYVD